jgi:hypothetical protein
MLLLIRLRRAEADLGAWPYIFIGITILGLFYLFRVGSRT